MGFHHIAMNVQELDKAVGFYCETLGFSRAFGWGEAPNRAVMLDTGDDNYLELFEKPGEVLQPGNVLLHFAVRTENLDALLEKVRNSGARITQEATDVDIPAEEVIPVRIAFFIGPHGETVELFEERF